MLAAINAPFEYGAAKVGASPDDLKLLFSFFLSYPLAAGIKLVPVDRPDLKHKYIIATSVFYLLGLFNLYSGLVLLAVMAASTYALATAYAHKSRMPWVTFVLLMIFMSVSHIKRQFWPSAYSVDVSGAQMVMVIKLSAFCWNIYDASPDSKQHNAFLSSKKITKIPTYLEFASFVLFFPALFAGPSFHYVDYINYIDGSIFKFDNVKNAPPTRRGIISHTFVPAIKKAAAGTAYISLYIVLSPYFAPSYLLTDDFVEHGFIGRLLVIYLVSLVARLRYYGVWTLTEGACIISGFGFKKFDPKTGKTSWDLLCNIRPFELELAQNLRTYLASWNINTKSWLQNYIYVRLAPKKSRLQFRATMAVFVTSALWHGFYPGYYMSFVFATFVKVAAQRIYQLVHPQVPKTPSAVSSSPSTSSEKVEKVRLNQSIIPANLKPIYDMSTFITTQLVMSFLVAPFLLLSWSDSWTAWTRLYLFGIAAPIGALVFISSPVWTKLTKYSVRRGTAIQLGIEKKNDEVIKDTDSETETESDPDSQSSQSLSYLNSSFDAIWTLLRIIFFAISGQRNQVEVQDAVQEMTEVGQDIRNELQEADHAIHQAFQTAKTRGLQGSFSASG